MTEVCSKPLSNRIPTLIKWFVPPRSRWQKYCKLVPQDTTKLEICRRNDTRLSVYLILFKLSSINGNVKDISSPYNNLGLSSWLWGSSYHAFFRAAQLSWGNYIHWHLSVIYKLEHISNPKHVCLLVAILQPLVHFVLHSQKPLVIHHYKKIYI